MSGWFRPASQVQIAQARMVGRRNDPAVLPYYLLHEPVICCVAWFAVRWQVPAPAKHSVLVVVSFTLTLAVYEVLIRPLGVVGSCSGRKDGPGMRPDTTSVSADTVFPRPGDLAHCNACRSRATDRTV